jgi:hypothetical protein
MARRDTSFEIEQVKQLALITGLSTHHGKPPPLNASKTESLFAKNHEPFFNAIDPKRTSAYLFCRDAVYGCRMVMAKGRKQQFGPMEQILARFTAQTNPAVTRRRPIRPRGP